MKSIKAALKRKSQKGQAAAWGHGCMLCSLGEGGADLPPWPCLMAYQIIKEGLTSSIPPRLWLPTQPGNQWEHPRPRLGSGPILPTQRMTHHTSGLPLFPTSYQQSTVFFFFSALTYFHHPLSQYYQALYALWYIWNAKSFSGRAFHHSVRIGFSCTLTPAIMPTCLMSHKM